MISLCNRWLDKEVVGAVAATCTTISFVPQLLHVWKSKSAKDISLKMFLLFAFGVALWIVYGVMNQSPSVLMANVVTLALALVIICLKLRYDRREACAEQAAAGAAAQEKITQ